MALYLLDISKNKLETLAMLESISNFWRCLLEKLVEWKLNTLAGGDSAVAESEVSIY
jgi:hypothetical protein